LQVKNYQGDTLFKAPTVAKSEHVLSKESAFIISDILSDNNARRAAFGSNSQLEIPGAKVAVKTGTTNDKRDNWTIGYTPQFLVAVWVGNNNNSPMNRALTSGVTGAAPIWNKTMRLLLDRTKPSWFTPPPSIITKNCPWGTEYFNSNNKEKVICRNLSVSPTPNF
jgi:membrane peptidoglycan carboxypeptidase